MTPAQPAASRGEVADVHLKWTTSLCPECLKRIPAEVVERRGQVLLLKSCVDHGYFEAIHPFAEPKHYRAMSELYAFGRRDASIPEHYTIDLTNACNMTCPTCFQEANDRVTAEPTLEEVEAKLDNIPGGTVYLMGGEPTISRNFFEIGRRVRARGLGLAVFSNGKKMVDRQFVERMRAVGFSLVLLQFDSLEDSQAAVLRGERGLPAMRQRALDNLRAAGIPVALMMAVQGQVNDDQFGPVFDFACRNADVIDLLVLAPTWKTGRYLDSLPIAESSELFTRLTAAVGVTLDDMIDGARFSHLFFECLRLLAGRSWTRQPACDLRALMCGAGGASSFAPLGRFVDLPRLSARLDDLRREWEERRAAGRVLPGGWRRFLSALASGRSRAGRGPFAYQRLMARSLVSSATRSARARGVRAPATMFSLMASKWPDRWNIDFDMVNTCTLSADVPGTSRFTPACVRQIFTTSGPRDPAAALGVLVPPGARA
ncbi:MAG: radical SAM protein [Planctomycetes bacterium]|nr:radical SAM protein [Planctomycetota bacterium]